MRFWLFLLFLATAAPALAQALSSPNLEAQAAANMARGDALYAYDQSAWHVTDAAIAALPKSVLKLSRGYIATPADDGVRTTFFAGEPNAYFRLYTAIWANGAIGRPEMFDPKTRTPVTPEEARLIAAREVALNNAVGLMMCSKARHNTVVIPGATPSDPISVYIMTPQSQNGVFPVGGHHRLDVKDGVVVAKRTFTNSCIALERPRTTKKQGEPVGMIITHLLDPVPTEIHAFTMLSAGLPLYVAVPDGTAFMVGRKDGKVLAKVIRAAKP